MAVSGIGFYIGFNFGGETSTPQPIAQPKPLHGPNCSCSSSPQNSPGGSPKVGGYSPPKATYHFHHYSQSPAPKPPEQKAKV